MKNSETLRAKRCKATCLFKSGSSHRCFPVGIGNFSEHFFCKTFANDCFYYFMYLIFENCREAFLVLQMRVIWRIESVSSAFYYILFKKIVKFDISTSIRPMTTNFGQQAHLPSTFNLHPVSTG